MTRIREATDKAFSSSPSPKTDTGEGSGPQMSSSAREQGPLRSAGPAVGLGIQPKLTLNESFDAAEKEAQAVASRVMLGKRAGPITAVPAARILRQDDGESSESAEEEKAEENGRAGRLHDDARFLLVSLSNNTFEEAMQALAVRGGNTDPHVLLRELIAFRNSSSWRHQSHEQQSAARLDRAIRKLEALALAGVSEDVMNIINGLSLSDEQKKTLLEAISLPYPRADLSDEIIRKISEEELARNKRMILLGALESPAFSRGTTDVQGLDTEGGGYLEASERNVEEFENYFEKKIPEGLELDPGDLLKQSTDLARENPDYEGLPPREIWSQMGPTLELLGEFEEMTGVTFTVESSYRSELVNALAGGALGSKHQSFAGLDLQPSDPSRFEAFIKHFWHQRGRANALGLGFYRPRRIHIDTLGYRRWGATDWAGKYDAENKTWAVPRESSSTSRNRFQKIFGVQGLDDL